MMLSAVLLTNLSAAVYTVVTRMYTVGRPRALH